MTLTFWKYNIGLILLSFFFSFTAFAQEGNDPYVNTDRQNKKTEEKGKTNNNSFTDKLRYGGSFGAYFGQQTYVELSPRVGYKLKERFIVGTGVNYMYFSVKSYGQKFVSHIYGPSFFAQYGIISGLFAHGEFNAFNIKVYQPLPPYNAERIWIGSAPVGLGYYSGGHFGGAYLAILYDLINNPYSPYYNGGLPLVLRVGLLF
ncbi:MAG: hypothetical protein IT238_02050 [Bacteroidia bacterium]|nr:hypothetical protein [Bacteroidia bacterium]MCZ2249415.1 hypothetical protein [Bacteroidia bacterium]